MKLLFLLFLKITIEKTLLEKYSKLDECNANFYKKFNINPLKIPNEIGSKLCPSIITSCCKKLDFINLNNYFKIKIKPILESNYLILKNVIIKSIKNKDLTNKILNFYKNILNFRSKIYCFICDHYSYIRLFNIDEKEINYEKNNLILSKEFCNELIKTSIEGLYLYNNYYIPLLNKKYKLKIKSDIDVNDCYIFNKDFYCNHICEKFNIFKTNFIFDGNITVLKMINNNIKINNFKNNIDLYHNKEILKYNNIVSDQNGMKIDKFIDKNSKFLINFNNEFIIKIFIIIYIFN